MRPVVALRSVDPQFVEKILPGIAVAHHSPPPCAKLVAAQVCHSLAGRPPAGHRQSSSIVVDSCHPRSEEHTSELRHPSISYAVFCLKKKRKKTIATTNESIPQLTLVS